MFSLPLTDVVALEKAVVRALHEIGHFGVEVAQRRAPSPVENRLLAALVHADGLFPGVGMAGFVQPAASQIAADVVALGVWFSLDAPAFVDYVRETIQGWGVRTQGETHYPSESLDLVLRAFVVHALGECLVAWARGQGHDVQAIGAALASDDQWPFLWGAGVECEESLDACLMESLDHLERLRDEGGADGFEDAFDRDEEPVVCREMLESWRRFAAAVGDGFGGDGILTEAYQNGKRRGFFTKLAALYISQGSKRALTVCGRWQRRLDGQGHRQRAVSSVLEQLATAENSPPAERFSRRVLACEARWGITAEAFADGGAHDPLKAGSPHG